MALSSSRLRRPNAKGDGPPVMSREFLIQNHADIISCVCVVVFLGLIPQVTHEIASRFIFLQYNKTIEAAEKSSDPASSRVDNQPIPITMYEYGFGDLYNMVFYSLIWIIMHAVIHEYIWERTVRKLHLSKTKTYKYLDSGWMTVFYLISVIWGIDQIVKQGYLFDYFQSLWDGYPHTLMSLSHKFFMLVQMSFWFHCYPELYLMKIKQDEIYSKVVLYTTSLLIIALAYVTYLQRLALILLVCHYSVDFLFHSSRLLHYHGKDQIAATGFKAWWILFIFARILTVALSVLTLGFGVQQSADPVLLSGIDLKSPVIRFGGLVFILALQMWLLLTFLSYQRKRTSESSTTASTASTVSLTKKNSKNGSRSKNNKKSE